MDSSKILKADILDILFEGKNKEYGAYELRKTYNRRFFKALLTTTGVIIIVVSGYAFCNRDDGSKKQALYVKDTELEAYHKEEPITPPPPPPKLPPPPAVEMKQFTPPIVVPDKDVKADEKPPENDQLDDVKIGTANVQGAKDDGIVAPPTSNAGTGLVEAPKKADDDDATFRKVEIESTYPGGMEAWKRYLNKNFRYPDEAQAQEIQGVVMVQFIVDKEGNVSEVQAVSGPTEGGLREEAVRVIKKSGKWTPAIQNGRQVKSYKNQPITFRMGD